MRIRKADKGDAKSFLQFQCLLDQEATYMLFEPHERTTTVRQQKKVLAEILQADTSCIYFALDKDEIIGYVGIYGSYLERIRHVGYLTIGIRQAYCNQGIGKQLLERADMFAKASGIKRLELTVVKENKSAVHLYKKCGFQEEGIRKSAVCIGGVWMDELYMAKFI